MAITSIGLRGTQISSASGTTVARAPTAAVSAGRVLFCWVAQNGNANTTVTDAVGNTWQFIGSGSNSAGNARSDLWLCNVTNAIGTGNNITVTLDTAVVHKSMALWEYSVDTGNYLVPIDPVVPNESTGNGFGSAAITGLTSRQRLFFRALAKQANNTGTITATTGFTSHGLNIRTQNNAATIAQRGEFRINTSTGETSNPTWAVAGNTGNVFAAFIEEQRPITGTADLLEEGEDTAAGVDDQTASRVYFEEFISGTVTTPDAALLAPNGIFTTDGNTANSWSGIWRFQPIAGNLEPVGGSTIAIVARKGSNSGDPSITAINIIQGGNSFSVFSGNQVISNIESQTLYYFDFDTTDLASGLTDIRLEIITSSAGGGPTARNSVEIDSVLWVVETEEAQQIITGSGAVTEVGNDIASASGRVIVQGSGSPVEVGADTATASGRVIIQGSGSPVEVGNDIALGNGSSVIITTGSGAVTEVGNDVAAASGRVIIQGSGSPVEVGADTATASGRVIIQGSGSVTEIGNDAAAASGRVIIQGSGFPVEVGADVVVSSGTILIRGSGSLVEVGADVVSAFGQVAFNDITGLANITEVGNDVAAASGRVIIQGSGSAADQPDTATASGRVIVQGSGAVTEVGNDVATASGTILIKGSGAVTEIGNDVSSASGRVVVQGSASSTDQPDTATASGRVVVQGSGTVTEVGADTTTAAGRVVVQGSGTVTEQPDTATASGRVIVQGSGSPSEPETDIVAGNGSNQRVGTAVILENLVDTANASGNVFISGSASATEQPDTVTASGRVIVQGSGSPVEVGNDAAFASGRVIVQGSGSPVEVGNDAAFASGGSFVSGFGSLIEQPDTLSAVGKVLISGSATDTEDPDTVSSTGKVIVLGQGSLVELSDNLTSTGRVLISGTISLVELPDTAFGTGSQTTFGFGVLVEEGEDKLVSKYLEDGYIEEGYFELKPSVFGKVLVQGDLSVSEDGLEIVSSTGRVPVQAAIQLQEDPDTLIAIGNVPIFGSIDISEIGNDLAEADGFQGIRSIGFGNLFETGDDIAEGIYIAVLSGIKSKRLNVSTTQSRLNVSPDSSKRLSIS